MHYIFRLLKSVASYNINSQVGKICTDWMNDIEGKPESEGSKSARGAIQIASMLAKGVAESGVLSDKSSLALKALATVTEGQATADVHTSWKERAKLGGEYLIRSS